MARTTIARLHQRFERAFARQADIGLLILRIVTGGHLVVMTWDNVTSMARMREFAGFLDSHGFAYPLACAFVSVAAQFVGGGALVLGAYTRLSGLVVAINFIVAIWMVDSKPPYPAAFAALALVAGGACLMFTGAGRWSLDRQWRGAS